MIKKVFLPLAILAMAVAVFVVLKQTQPDKGASQPPEKKWLVNAVDISFSRRAPEITIYGRVETPRDAMLKSALEADVAQVYVLEGDEVDAGQLLLKLDDTDASLLLQQRQADVDEILAAIDSENARFQRDKQLLSHQQQLVELAQRAVSRAQKLEQTRLASQAALDDSLAAREQQLLTLKQLEHDINEHPTRLAQLEASLKRARALLKQAQVDLARSEIRAPFSGRVSSLNVALGDRVRAGDNLLGVYDLNSLEVRAQIPGRHISQIRQMMQQEQALIAQATVEGKPLQFRLARLSGEVRPDSGGIDGLFALVDGNEPLPLGTFVELHLQLAEQERVVVLPFSALYGLDRIYRIESGFLQSVTIERVGETRDADGNRLLLIRSAELNSGDRIAVTQLPNAMTGLRVEVSGD